MSKKMALVIMSYGAAICGIAAAFQLNPSAERSTIYASLIAGAGALGIGVAAWLGEQRRRWILLMSAGFCVFLLVRMVDLWVLPIEADTGSHILTSLSFLLTVGILLYSMHAERSPDFYEVNGGRGAVKSGSPHGRKNV